jgi:hypothetical protein
MSEPEESGKGEKGHTRMVLIYCTLCGNRKAKNAETGEEVDFVVGMTAEMIAEIRADAKCVYCGSPMDIKFVDELEEGRE